MSYYDTCPTLPSSTFEVRYAVLSEFASVVVRPKSIPRPGPWSRAFRKQVKVVQSPRRLYWRKDGLVTVTGANKENTVTFSASDMILVGTTWPGTTVILNL